MVNSLPAVDGLRCLIRILVGGNMLVEDAHWSSRFSLCFLGKEIKVLDNSH